MYINMRIMANYMLQFHSVYVNHNLFSLPTGHMSSTSTRSLESAQILLSL